MSVCVGLHLLSFYQLCFGSKYPQWFCFVDKTGDEALVVLVNCKGTGGVLRANGF